MLPTICAVCYLLFVLLISLYWIEMVVFLGLKWCYGTSCSRIHTSPPRTEPAKGYRDQYEAWSNQPTSDWESREVDDGRAHCTIGRRAAPGACQKLDETLHATDSFRTAKLLWFVDMDFCDHITNQQTYDILYSLSTYASLLANVISNYPSCISISMF